MVLVVSAGTEVTLLAKEGIDEEINSRYVSTCPSGKKHYMESKAWANVYDGVYPNGTLKWKMVPKYQCKYCHVIIVTKYEVTGSRPIGEYTIWHPQEPVNSILLILYTTNFYYESGKELSGYEFH